MQPPSEPQINKSNPSKWFIYYNHDVPYPLWGKYKRKRIRIKVYDGINHYQGEAKETYAELRRKVWKYQLEVLKYNPFEEELKEFQSIKAEKIILEDKIENFKKSSKEEHRENTPIDKALELFIKSRKARKLDATSISSYKGSVDWLLEGLRASQNEKMTVSKIKHTNLSEALDFISEERQWSATTINKEVGFLMTIFNWFETEDYIVKNPSKKKFVKLPTSKTKHTWYDRELAATVKDAVLKSGKLRVYQAMQFTYWILIRSKKELRMLKVGDIDFTLKRIRFSTELSKNNNEEYRDYPPAFEAILKEMDIRKYPKHYYIFGANDGSPGEVQCSHNYFSKQFKVIKDQINLSPDYTIYGWKHTRIVHELMKGTEGPEISYMARHSDFKTTKEYLRDYDITLKNIYRPEDLTF